MSYSINLPAKRIVASYVFDWIVIIAIAAIGGGLNFVSPYHRPFSLVDLDISYPFVPESISAGALAAFTLGGGAALILIVVAAFVPGPAYCRTHSRSEVIRRKLWEFEKGWAGLALSLATAFFFTQALKNIFGKPRPDLLARCMPDYNILREHIVGGYAQDISIRWSLFDSGICTQTDQSILDDGFRSFPSGHSSFSWASMLYLSLFLASKFAIAIPFVPDYPAAHDPDLNRSNATELLPLHSSHSHQGHHRSESTEYLGGSSSTTKPAIGFDRGVDNAGQNFANHTPTYNRAAAPPVHLIVLVMIPICVAFYVNSTRYVEFYHHGFDIICGSLIGILAAYFSFRWYHGPIRKGAGWAWGPRSRDRAWGIGVGTDTYVGSEGWSSANGRRTQSLGRGRNGEP